MFKIEQITSDPYQKQTLVLTDKTKVKLTLYYMPMQYGWFIKELVYESFTLNNYRVCNSLNLLHQFRNKLPFGLACISNQNREPMFVQDFSSGFSNLYLLTSDEVEQVNQVILNG
jgi:hypothetical protein